MKLLVLVGLVRALRVDPPPFVAERTFPVLMDSSRRIADANTSITLAESHMVQLQRLPKVRTHLGAAIRSSLNDIASATHLAGLSAATALQNWNRSMLTYMKNVSSEFHDAVEHGFHETVNSAVSDWDKNNAANVNSLRKSANIWMDWMKAVGEHSRKMLENETTQTGAVLVADSKAFKSAVNAGVNGGIKANLSMDEIEFEAQQQIRKSSDAVTKSFDADIDEFRNNLLEQIKKGFANETENLIRIGRNSIAEEVPRRALREASSVARELRRRASHFAKMFKSVSAGGDKIHIDLQEANANLTDSINATLSGLKSSHSDVRASISAVKQNADNLSSDWTRFDARANAVLADLSNRLRDSLSLIASNLRNETLTSRANTDLASMALTSAATDVARNLSKALDDREEKNRDLLKSLSADILNSRTDFDAKLNVLEAAANELEQLKRESELPHTHDGLFAVSEVLAEAADEVHALAVNVSRTLNNSAVMELVNNVSVAVPTTSNYSVSIPPNVDWISPGSNTSIESTGSQLRRAVADVESRITTTRSDSRSAMQNALSAIADGESHVLGAIAGSEKELDSSATQIVIAPRDLTAVIRVIERMRGAVPFPQEVTPLWKSIVARTKTIIDEAETALRGIPNMRSLTLHVSFPTDTVKSFADFGSAVNAELVKDLGKSDDSSIVADIATGNTDMDSLERKIHDIQEHANSSWKQALAAINAVTVPILPPYNNLREKDAIALDKRAVDAIGVIGNIAKGMSSYVNDSTIHTIAQSDRIVHEISNDAQTETVRRALFPLMGSNNSHLFDTYIGNLSQAVSEYISTLPVPVRTQHVVPNATVGSSSALENARRVLNETTNVVATGRSDMQLLISNVSLETFNSTKAMQSMPANATSYASGALKAVQELLSQFAALERVNTNILAVTRDTTVNSITTANHTTDAYVSNAYRKLVRPNMQLNRSTMTDADITKLSNEGDRLLQETTANVARIADESSRVNATIASEKNLLQSSLANLTNVAEIQRPIAKQLAQDTSGLQFELQEQNERLTQLFSELEETAVSLPAVSDLASNITSNPDEISAVISEQEPLFNSTIARVAERIQQATAHSN